MMTNNNRIELKKWKFCIDQTGYGEGSGWAGKYFDDSSWAEVETCTCWENFEHALFDYEGRAWFRTRFTPTTPGRKCILHFEGIGGSAKVFVNGRLMGGTDNRYLPFEVDASLAVWESGENVVAVLVDNRYFGKTHLTGGQNIEWVLYGGLTHRVWVEERKSIEISHLRVDAACDGSAKVTVTIDNKTGKDTPADLALEIAGLPEFSLTKEVLCPRTAESRFVLEGKAADVKLWSPEEPNLYDLKVTLTSAKGVVLSEATERIGFRTISVEGTKILLNGKDYLLKGANRYDEYHPYGNCPPEEVIREEFLTMKKAGLNLIRTHYPQDPIHYRLADELGLMYMIEVPLNWWNPAPEDTLFDHINLVKEAVQCLDGTFYWHCNHPCWTIWSVGNECAHSAPAAQKAFRMLAERIRNLKTNRLVTYAANKPLLNSEELDFCDILSMNYYSGIKSETVADFPEQLETILREKLRVAQELYPNVPHMMSEFGYVGIGGIYNSPEGGRYTEDYGATFLKKKVEEFLKDPQMRGLVIWCWADYRHRRGFVPSPAGMGFQATYGPYGLVTIDRKPKQLQLDVMTELYTNWK